MNPEDIRTRGCKVCVNQEAQKYEEAYFTKTLSVDEIVKELGISNYTFYKHIRDHIRPEAAMTISGGALVLAEQVIDKQGLIVEILEDLRSQSRKTLTVLDGELDINMIKAYTMLVAEQRRTIKLLAELQGEFNLQDVKSVTNNYNIEFTQVVDKIMQVACQTCRPKFAEELKPIILRKVENKS